MKLVQLKPDDHFVQKSDIKVCIANNNNYISIYKVLSQEPSFSTTKEGITSVINITKPEDKIRFSDKMEIIKAG